MPRPLPTAVLLLLFSTSCGSGRERPVARPEPPALRVLHTSPHGALEGPEEIHVVFDRPVVPEGMSEARPGTVQIQPPIPGTMHPVGLSAIVFIPDDPLPPATRFRVEIPEGVLGNDGTTLEEAVVFHFETARPRVIESLPRTLTALRNDQPFLFKFDQLVEVAELGRRAHFVVNGQTQPATVVADPADPAYLRVTPARPLPGGATAELVIDGALVGTRGPLPMGRDVRVAFTVHGRPGIVSATCDPLGCMRARVVLATPLPRDAIPRVLRVEPPATLRLPDDEPRISELSLTDLRPSTRYRIVLAAGAADIFGQSLAQEAAVDLAVPALAAEVRPAFVGSVLPPGQARALPFRAVNVARATVRVDRLAPQQITGTFRSEDPLPGQLAYAPSVPVSFGAARDVWQTASAALDRILGGGPGVFGIAVDEGAPGVAPLMVTDLDVAARWSERGGVVWLSSMTTGAPAARARIDVRDDRGRMVLALETDAQGVARLPASIVRAGQGTGELFLIARRESEFSFVQGDAVPVGSARVATLVTDQRVYARGDTIHVKGIFSARGAAPGENATIRVTGAGGTFGATQATPSALGTFAADLDVPEWAAYGPYKVEASGAGDAWTASTSVEVRPAAAATPRVSVELGRELYVLGQTAVFQVRARHPVRGNLAGAVVGWRAVGRPLEFRPAGFGTYHFGPAGRRAEGAATVLAEGSGTLGDDGGLADSVRLTGAPDTPMRVRIEAQVAGAGVGLAETWGHPSSLYAGLRVAALPGANGETAVDVVALQPSGRPARASVQVEAQRYRHELEDGRARPVAEGRVLRCRVSTTEQGGASCRVALREAGVYLVTATVTDSRGYRSVSSQWVLREGRAEIGNAVPTEAALFVAMGPQGSGRAARVLVASPFDEARALLFVGGEGVDGAQVVSVPRGITGVNVPVSDAMRPSAPVHLYLAGPRGQVIEAEGRIVVGGDDRALRVAIEPDATDKAPGERMELRVRVTGADGAPVGSADVTVAVQDAARAGLDLDPGRLLYPGGDLPVVAASLRPEILRPAPPPRATTSTSVVEPAPPSATVGRTVYWNADVLTEPDGTAVVRFTLPEGASRYRIVALALASGGKAGIGDTLVSTSAPVRIEPRMAPALRSGDETTAVMTVVNDTNAALPVELNPEASNLGLVTTGAQRVNVPANGTTDVRIDVRTVGPGPASLMVRGTAGSKLLVATLRTRVLAAGEEEIVTRTGKVEGAEASVALDVPADAAADEGGLSYTLSLHPAAAALALAEQAIEPRRQDTASLLESLVARAYLAKNARRFGGVPPERNTEWATELARRVGLRVSGDGRARHFPGGPAEVDLGAWVGIGFGAAKRAGIAVPRRAAPASFSTHQAPLVTWARKLQGLAFAPLARIEAGDEAPSVTDAALRLMTSPGDDRGALAGVLVSAIERDADEPALERVRPTLPELTRGVTAVRATALAALALLEDERPAEPLLRGLLGLREHGGYRAPLDTVAALLAFDASFDRTPPAAGRTASASVLVGGSPAAGAELRAGLPAARGEIPLALLLSARQSSIEVRRRGAAPVFFDLIARFRRIAPMDDPADRGFAIERVYERVVEGVTPANPTGAMPGRTERQFGTDGAIRVHVRLANGLVRRHVVLVDDLPAGCTRVVEAVPSESGPFAPVETAPPSRAEFYAAELPPGVHHLSYLVRPNHPGRYFAPGATIELLDDPGVWGRSAGDVIAVEGR